MKRYLTLFFIILLFSPSVSARAEGGSAELVTEYIEDAMDLYQIPGAALIIIDDGEEILNEQWGVLSNEKMPTADTPFLIGSLSKPFTALAILMLAEDGKIDLDQPIETYLPQFDYNAAGDQKITVYQLLRQTSGISQYEGLKVTDRGNTDNWNISEAEKELSRVTLANSPGEVYEYNSANYLLLGSIVENVSGEKFDEFLINHVFNPLQMNHTGANAEQMRDLGLVAGFESWFGKPIESEFLYDPAGAPYGYIASTANDLAKFLAFLLEGSGEILSEEMMDIYTEIPEGDHSYGIGWHINEEGNFLFHGGATPAFRAEMYFRPEIEQAAIVLTNKYHTFEDPQVYYIMDGIRDLLDGSNPAPLPKQSHMVQWLLLAIVILLSIFAFLRLFKKSQKQRSALSYGISIISVLIAAGFIPIFVSTQNIPWRSFQLFAPDLAFLAYCLIFLFLLHAVIPLKSIVFKEKGRSISK